MNYLIFTLRFLKNHFFKFTLALFFAVLFLISFFPFSDLNDYVSSFISEQTQGKVYTQFEDLQVLVEFAKEDADSEKELDEQFPQLVEKIENLEFKNMLSNEGDELSAVLQITAGAGGTESCDWASMLMRMYQM